LKTKASLALGLLGGAIGRYTPFLSPYWGDAERGILAGWLEGNAFPDAAGRLSALIRDGLGPEWTVRPMNLGRSAIQLALQAMDLPGNSEVILPAFSCNGVAAPVLQAGHKPVFADVDGHFNLRYESVIEAYSPAVRAVVVPHLSGCWNRSTFRILEWAKARGIYVIEDAAQSMGLEYSGQAAGTFGDVGIFSCNGGKQIMSSGGAWLVTKHPALAKRIAEAALPPESRESVASRIRRFQSVRLAEPAATARRRIGDMLLSKLSRRHSGPETASSIRFEMVAISDIEAQLALAQLPKLREMIQRRAENARRWKELLAPLPTNGIGFLPDEDNIWTKMLLSFTGPSGPAERHALGSALAQAGVECESSYVPLDKRGNYLGCRTTSMETTDRQWDGAFSLPVRPNLDQADWIRIRRAAEIFGDALARNTAGIRA
jgi:perosamine synthetase